MKFALIATVATVAAVQLEGVPARFSADSDDIFMRSVLNNYASEGANDDGSGNGVFNTSEGQAKALAQEVLATHKQISGPAQEAYLASYWAKAWGHFDVNKTGAMPSMYAPGLMRFLASDQYMSL
jgi:hypothetical protein